ncbi:chemotaxis protein CheW [Massilia solisilvae]|uniref:Chemotaxis protein CheW n=1 Tax=Massilia solisilvae TaxID=1811225 RepID=A0ABT2BG76_9BURK|nr:chemotaxis protein CheW [Massilia solisilvae]MCS0607521.1 chemotaxis protein CheW [Massilia solisilvae]
MQNDTSGVSQQIKFLSFTLGGLEYGLDFGKVQELRVLKSLERFAADGEIISGVAVSRGIIMPIVDMRAAFSVRPAQPPSPLTDVIILKLSSGTIGMVVDGVSGVVSFAAEQITPIPGANGQVEYLLGLGRIEGRRLILVDIDRLMSIHRAAKQAEKVVA